MNDIKITIDHLLARYLKENGLGVNQIDGCKVCGTPYDTIRSNNNE